MAWSQSWAGAGPGWANIYFFLSGHGGGKRFKVWEGCTFLAEVRRKKSWQARRGRLLVGPGRAGLGRGQAEANEDDPEQWPGWAAPVFFFRGVRNKNKIISQRRILIPPCPGAGIAIKGDAWVSGWYPAATELRVLQRPTHHRKLVSLFLFLRFLRRQEASPSSRTLIFFT